MGKPTGGFNRTVKDAVFRFFGAHENFGAGRSFGSLLVHLSALEAEQNNCIQSGNVEMFADRTGLIIQLGPVISSAPIMMPYSLACSYHYGIVIL
ncbi:hypothetical protein [Roseibium sp. RKSG952]|uniref:hypothetical protein n=1 Tax=Roseibium sp. RKSG952 TaxID=2529384 RepID=UPI0012BCB28E|nr:hypothetical protein [Roseibium sp. RKSG952]MTH95840.1 hypothetical protein [Roseibium sp. RKSG952]